MSMRCGLSFLLLCLLLCPSVAWAQKIQVCVSIPPQKTFVTALGQDLVHVEVMVSPGSSPATYEPRPSQLRQLADTDLYAAIGVPFERAWLDKFAAVNPGMRIVHTDAQVHKRALPSSYDLHKEAVDSGHTEHTGIKDPHIWLSPALVAIQAENLCQALQEVDPEHAADYEHFLQTFLQEIESIEATLEGILEPVRGESFLVFHPAWGYFAQAFGLHQVAVELEGKRPKPAQLAQVVSFAQARDIQAIFVQPQFSTKSARMIAREIGAQVYTADPLAEDWASNLMHMARQIEKALQSSEKSR